MESLSAREPPHARRCRTREPLSARRHSEPRSTCYQVSETSGESTKMLKPTDAPGPRRRRPYPKQLPEVSSALTTNDVSANATDTIFRPGIQHQNRTKQILALFEEKKMFEEVDELEYETDMPLDDFVGYMERRHDAHLAFRKKVQSINGIVTPDGMTEGMHPEVRRVIEERLSNGKE
eukprot:gnl/MRDRNA2_/MRDRNA2_27718_c0_seq1.p1 gnl/MRDRNA2_/MRDRNA2_27718_c0~~gnl/MRDRNA2_/MRDRNA2_27718_c0_seq1.p1  ORF type:complete len:186 (+),score=30.39 gnl/MRDRNA2_/MRDRNA2_27718_c0_seq1:25-558(+)